MKNLAFIVIVNLLIQTQQCQEGRGECDVLVSPMPKRCPFWPTPAFFVFPLGDLKRPANNELAFLFHSVAPLISPQHARQIFSCDL